MKTALIHTTAYPVSGPMIEDATILIEDGTITGIGCAVDLDDDVICVDLSGKFVTPGFIDAHCHIGIMAEGVGDTEHDVNERTDPITPQLRAIDAIHPQDMAFEDAVAGGVTLVNTGPGSANLVGGQCAVIRTSGRTIEEMAVLAPSAMKLALGENPKRIYGRMQSKAPATRMGNAALLREWLMKAQDYAQDLANADPSHPRHRDLRLQELAAIVRGELPVHIHCHRADDILSAIRLSEEFGLRPVIVHATEGYLVADVIAEKGIPCFVGPLVRSRRKYETRGMRSDNLVRLQEAGVQVAIQTDELSMTSLLRVCAALMVQQGLDEDAAMRAITLAPAEILGVHRTHGSLDVGKSADLVVLSAPPLDIAHAGIEQVYMAGRLAFSKC
jgi:imidazolonepropionase-like amidohydrolase